MKSKKQIFIPLCREKAQIQRERERDLSELLSENDWNFLRELKVKA